MDSYHRRPPKHDSRTGRDCQFCSQHDPNFRQRNEVDRSVVSEVGDTAAAHFSEDGYLCHRMLELKMRFGFVALRNAA